VNPLSVYLNQFVALDGIPNAIAALVFIGAVVFIVIYGTQSGWRSNAPGRALMYWVVSFAALVLMNTIHLATGRYPGIEFVRITVYSLLLYSVIRLIIALLHILRDGEQITTSTFVKPKPPKEKK
jgi:hypothetical protein